MSWIDQVNQRPTLEIAEQLGYEPRRHASASSCKCPACGAERRHTKSKDKRGAVGMPHNAVGWRCFQCEAAGDAIDFASYHIGSRRYRELTDERKAEVKSWFGFGDGGYRAAAPRPTQRKEPTPVALTNAHVQYPPLADVEALWAQCLPVHADSAARGYLEFRGITNLKALTEQDCVRVLPIGADVPGWAAFGERPWTRSAHRLIVPLFDAFGEMRSFVARSVERDPHRKSLGVTGYGRAGLVMAGEWARAVLQTGPARHWHRLVNLRLTVYEGEIDFVRAVANHEDAEIDEDFSPAAFRAVMGIFAGSFQRDVAARIPSATHVVLSTDADDDGDKYAAEIEERIGERCTYERVRLEQDRPPPAAGAGA